MYKYGKDLVSSFTSKISTSLITSPPSPDDKIEDSDRNSKRPADSKVATGYATSTCTSKSSGANVCRTNTGTTAATSDSPISEKRHNSKKRNRLDGHKTPMLVQFDSSQSSLLSENESSQSSTRPTKKKKTAGVMGQSNSLLLDMIPLEVLETHVFSFLTHGEDYYALQLTCSTMKSLSDKADILKKIDLSGEAETGKGSILRDVESPVVGVERLYKFASVGNQQALYMIGMIAAYCHGDKIGVTILKQTAQKGCLRSAYALGLILRDSNKSESEKYLNGAIERGYLPACQELLSSPVVKDKFGDLDHLTLKKFFDPIGLNRLLGRCYLHSNGVRGVATSHCWNPCCGRWALKATQSNDGRTPQLQSPSKCLPALSSHIEASLIQLVQKDQINGPGAVEGTCHESDEDALLVGSGNENGRRSFRVSRMKMCSSCRRAKYCSKLCQVYDWRSGRHKMECQYL